MRRRGGCGAARLRRAGEHRDPRLLPEQRRHDLQRRRQRHRRRPRDARRRRSRRCPDASACTPPGTGRSSLSIRWSNASRPPVARNASLGSRSFGGPQGAALTDADDAARACLTTAHEEASALVDTLVSVYHDCLEVERDGGACDVAATEAQANEDIEQLALAVGTACASLPALVSLDPPTFAPPPLRLAAPAIAPSSPLTSTAARARSDRHAAQSVRTGRTRLRHLRHPLRRRRSVRLLGPPRAKDRRSTTWSSACRAAASSPARTARRAPRSVRGVERSAGDRRPAPNDPDISPFADWTKSVPAVLQPGRLHRRRRRSNFDQVTVHRFGAINVRAAMRYVRDVVWRELDRDTDRATAPMA